MKSVLFLVTFSFCAAYGLFSAHTSAPQPALVEQSQNHACSKCGGKGHHLACEKCGDKGHHIACEKCKPIFKFDKTATLAGCSCKGKGKTFIAECGCKKGKGKQPGTVPPIVTPPTSGLTMACECQDLETALESEIDIEILV